MKILVMILLSISSFADSLMNINPHNRFMRKEFNNMHNNKRPSSITKFGKFSNNLNNNKIQFKRPSNSVYHPNLPNRMMNNPYHNNNNLQQPNFFNSNTNNNKHYYNNRPSSSSSINSMVHKQPNYLKKPNLYEHHHHHHQQQQQENKIQKPTTTIYYKPEKAFFSTSTSLTPHHHHHHKELHENNFETAEFPPMLINSVKQEGEKGPIRTIPAPNLTPADKPSNIRLFQQNNAHHHHQHVEEENNKIPSSSSLFTQNLIKIQPQQHYQVTETQQQQQYQDQQYHQPKRYFKNDQEIINNAPQNTDDIYYGKNSQQTQSTLPSSFNIKYLKSSSSSSSVNPPEYQSFNYDEQAHQKASSNSVNLVGATYTLAGFERNINNKDAEEEEEDSNSNSRISANSHHHHDQNQNNNDPTMLQAQIVQNYFASNNSALPNSNNQYFSTLPNKHIAEQLAKLHEAGKINNNLINKSSVEVYNKDDNEPLLADYEEDDYSQEELLEKSDENDQFGQKT